MPYPNFHAARVKQPEQFDTFRTVKTANPAITLILGIKDGKSEVQAVRADASKMSAAQFRKWLKDEKQSYLMLEPATGPTDKGSATSAKPAAKPAEPAKSERPSAPSKPSASKQPSAPSEVGKSFFSIFSDMELLEKSEEEGQDKGKAKIQGVISSECVDYQGDVIRQDGLDFSYFMRSGFLNDDHKSGPGAVVGEPVRIFRTEVNGKPATAMEGFLYLDKPRAREIYETAKAIRDCNGSRRLGFSIEGQVVERDPGNPKHILKARVLHVAVTHAPVNPDTSNLELLSRSMNAMPNNMHQVISNIMQMHPELMREGVLDALVSQVSAHKSAINGTQDEQPYMQNSAMPGVLAEKAEGGSVGYQTPAQPSATDALSALAGTTMQRLLSKQPSFSEESAQGRAAKGTAEVMYQEAPSAAYDMERSWPVAPPAQNTADSAADSAADSDKGDADKSYTNMEQSINQALLTHMYSSLKESFKEMMASEFARLSMPYYSSTSSAPSKGSAPSEGSDAMAQSADVSPKISSAQLQMLLQRQFPNMSATQSKNLAQRLVFLSKKRV
jgi:hypothetical protein